MGSVHETNHTFIFIFLPLWELLVSFRLGLCSPCTTFSLVYITFEFAKFYFLEEKKILAQIKRGERTLLVVK
ncbi:hypothetical protein LguiA_023380 [Lonicera macranthoides]